MEGLPRDGYPVEIGVSSPMRPGRYWPGWIDDVRICGYALTAEEVQAPPEATKALSSNP